MTRTNLIEAARQDAQSAADLRAALEALLAGSPPQKFTPPVAPEPETVYHHDVVDTRDLIGTHFVGPMAEK